MRRLALTLLALPIVLAACESITLAEGDAYKQTLDLALPSDRVFDALVSMSHDRDMTVAQIDKDAGVLVFEPEVITAADMDRYCKFPAIDEDGDPASTFAEHQQELVEGGDETLACRVEPSLLVEPITEDTCRLKLKTEWYAQKGSTDYECDSLGIWEDDFLSALKDALLAPKN